jgi:CheY-like chemotaxis protein
MATTLATLDLDRPLLALLVDRDADTRQLYAEFLRQLECDTDEAEDGREALAKAIARHPDVIVTETRLPGISGLDLCRLLRGDAATADISVLFVTADALEPDVDSAKAAGADGVLLKPCLPETLADAIVETIGHSRAPQPRHPNDLIARRRARRAASRRHDRRETIAPPIPPMQLDCPRCGRQLRYIKSFVGGVSERNSEQWDYFDCVNGCGSFQFRQRTQKLRPVTERR